MKENLENLEEVKFKVGKGAFSPEELSCCNVKMKKTQLEVKFENDIYIKLAGFECSKCKKKSLGLDEARRLDRAMIVSSIMGRDFKMKRNLSFDGDNYTFRIPKEFTHDVHKRKIEIVPLGAKEFCATVE